jgi:hypothetical protein
VIQGDAVGEDGVTQDLAKGCAVGHQAVEAAVLHGDGDHLPLRRVEVLGRLVELAVVGEPGVHCLRAPSQLFRLAPMGVLGSSRFGICKSSGTTRKAPD